MINLRSASQKRRYGQQTVRLLERLERGAITPIERAVQRLYSAVAKGNGVAGAEAALEAAILAASVRAIDTFSVRWQTEVVPRGEKRAKPKPKDDAPDDMVTIARRKWARKNAAEHVEDITTAVRKRVKAIVTEAVDQHPNEVARRLFADGEVFSRARARTIARTETHAAAMTTEAEMARNDAEELDLVITKEWVSTSDDRTRPDHDEANGQKVDAEGLFWVGGAKLDCPGDPSGPPEQVINCRCVMVYAVK